MRADDLVFPDMQVFLECGFTSRQGAVCGDFQTAYISLRRVRSGFYAQLQPAEILRHLRQTDPQKAENRERTQAEKWTVRHGKSLKNQGWRPPIWGNAYKIPRSLKIGGRTVHKQKRKDAVIKRKLVTVDAETLLSTPMSKTMLIVDGLILYGVNVLSGAAKIGKSWLMLWLELQVSQGLTAWGIPTMRCDVLYFYLEDTLKRIKDRLFDLTDDSTRSFHLTVTCGLIGNGLGEEIINFLEDFPKTKLVIINTLPKVRDSKGSVGKAGM